jgi:DNA-binding CsgD family transcriptional regulator
VRLFGAGLAAAMGGGYARGTALLEAAAEADDPQMRAAVRHLLAMVTLTGGLRNAIDNHAMLTAEAERIRSIDATSAAMMHSDAGVIAVVGGHCRLALESAERAIEALPADVPAEVRCQVVSMFGMGLALTGRTSEARAALDEAGNLIHAVDPLSPAAQSISFALHARICTGQAALLHAEARALAHAADAADSTGLLPYYELVAADSAYRLGDWEAAERDADEAVAIADHTRQHGPLSIALVVRARVHAARGEEAEARAAAARGIEYAMTAAYGSTVIWARATLGFLELGLGRATEAIAELEECARLVGIAGLEDPTIVPWAPDLVEAYTQAGLRERAEHLAGQYAQRAAQAGVALPLALAARCRGLTTLDGFDGAFAEALERHAESDAPFEEARTLLAYGSRLHRACRRVEARERLRHALAAFERLGAVPWAERARAELRAAGAVQREVTTRRDELTAQEARVAAAVARGATNREVGAELFLSPKTVEFHLGRVFRKLGIRSRTELAVLVAEGEAGLAPDLADQLERSL